MFGNRKCLAELARELEEREELMSYVFEATGDGIWDWHVDSETVSHNISWCLVLGLDEAHLEHSMDFYVALIHPDDLENVNAALKACLDGVCDYSAEYRLRHTRGGYIWVMDRGKVVERRGDGSPIRMVGAVRDITERRRLEMQVQEQKLLLDTILNNADAYIYMKDSERRYLYANVKTAALFGQPQEHIVGKLDADMMPQEDADRFGVMDRQALELGQKVCGEETFLDSSGLVRHYWSIKVPLHKGGKIDSFIGISTDITEIITLKENFQTLANTDAMTGISSRRHLIECGEHELKKTQRRSCSMAVIMFDIDRFKSVNDGYGHATGDRAIIAVAEACKKNLREIDWFGRMGGDEFVVVLPETSLHTALIVAERMRVAISAANVMCDDESCISVTSSFGLAMAMADDSFDKLLSRADAALYAAKHNGRNCVWHGESSASS